MANACPVRDAFQVSVINLGFYTHATAADEHLRAWNLPAILEFCVDDSERHIRLRRATGYYCSQRGSVENSCTGTAGDVGRLQDLKHTPIYSTGSIMEPRLIDSMLHRERLLAHECRSPHQGPFGDINQPHYMCLGPSYSTF